MDLPDLYADLKRYWGYDSFRPMQERIIQSLMGGSDVAVVMPTGGGKSLCYQLPALAMGQTVAVISPLIALMQDQVAQLEDMGIPAALLNSSQAADEQRTVMRAAQQGAYRLLYLSPERLARQDTVAWLQKLPLAFFAIDEAHCISEWGHEFRPDYRQLSSLRANFPDKPIAAFTASATKRVRQDILDQLRLREPHKYIASFHRANLRYVAHQCDNKSHARLLVAALKAYPGESVIVYAPTIREVEQTVDYLADRKIAAVPYHGQMERAQRVRPGDQQAGGAGGDPPVAAEIHRAVLPGGGPRRPRRVARRLRHVVAAERRRAAGLFHRPVARPERKRARLAAVSHGAAVRGKRPLPASADLHALRADAQVGAMRDVRRVRKLASVACGGAVGRTGGEEEKEAKGQGGCSAGARGLADPGGSHAGLASGKRAGVPDRGGSFVRTARSGVDGAVQRVAAANGGTRPSAGLYRAQGRGAGGPMPQTAVEQ